MDNHVKRVALAVMMMIASVFNVFPAMAAYDINGNKVTVSMEELTADVPAAVLGQYYESGGKGGGSLPHKPRHGGAAVRLPDLCLLKPYPETDAAGRVCPWGAECFPCKCGRAGAGASGGCGVYLFYGNGASAPAAAGGNAGGRELPALAAAWP